MKKLLLIAAVITTLTGCTDQLNPEKMLESSMNPFREYKITDTKIAEDLENGILRTEANKYGIDLEKSSAHLVSLKKIGTYGTGEIRILGRLTDKGIAQAENNRFKNVNSIVTYTCKFEYSYKNGSYSWVSDFPYSN